MFEKGIFDKEKKLWLKPNFERFEAKFRKKWLIKKQKESNTKNDLEKYRADKSFEE